MFYKFVKVLVRWYFHLFYRVSVTGLGNEPESGGVLMYANHPSAADMFLIACHMKRQVHFMAKEELFKNPILAFFMRRLGAFPVARGKGDVGSVKTVFKLLKQGEIVGVFPEGTRTPRKDPKKQKAGAAMIALHSGAKVLPVGVVWKRRPFSRIRVVLGKTFILRNKNPEKHVDREELIGYTNKILDLIYGLIGQ